MPFYDLSLSSKNLSRIIADCYQILGRRETIGLLDRMKEDRLPGVHPVRPVVRPPATCGPGPTRRAILKDKDKEVEKLRKQFERGVITEQERYNKVLEQWGEAREKITSTLMEALKHDRRKDATTGKEVPLHEPDLPDGQLRGPGRRRADPAARRPARADGQAVRRDHRDADQVQLPRRADGAGILLQHARGPEGVGGHGPQDRRLRLPDAKARGRGPERRHHDEDCGTTQGISKASSTRGTRSIGRWPRASAAGSAGTNSATR